MRRVSPGVLGEPLDGTLLPADFRRCFCPHALNVVDAILAVKICQDAIDCCLHAASLCCLSVAAASWRRCCGPRAALRRTQS